MTIRRALPLIAAGSLVLAACGDDDESARIAVADASVEPVLLVALHDTPAGSPDDLQDYIADVAAIAADYEGGFLLPPIENFESLENDASPPTVGEIDGDLVLLLEFQNRAYLDAFVADDEQSGRFAGWSADQPLQQRFVAAPQPAPPGVPAPPAVTLDALASVGASADGAMLTLNAFDIAFDDPDLAVGLGAYTEQALPAFAEVGLVGFSGYDKVADLDGTFPFAGIALGEWPSRDDFFSFHAAEPFRSQAIELRNPALRAFAEHHVRVLAEIDTTAE